MKDRQTMKDRQRMMQVLFPGEDELLDYLEAAGYYSAPASTKYHGAYPGGLFDHSYMVMLELKKLSDQINIQWERPESPVYIGMLHDLCKMDAYIEKPDSYAWNGEQLFTGHGEKSCILALQHVKLTTEELACIRYHMGAFTDKEEWQSYNNAVSKYPNILYVHLADMLASQVRGI